MGKHRAYCFTWNNYPASYANALDAIECRYIVAGEETAPETGTRHLQGYVYFSSRRHEASVRRILSGCHVEPAKGSSKQNHLYCTKTRPTDGEPNVNVYTRGDLPMDAADRGAVERTRWESAWDAAKRGDLEAIPADIRMRQYSTIRRIERDYMPAVIALTSPCGIWVFGVAGSGKTRAVSEAYPGSYPKPRNQWWDGYQREPIVVLDDVDKFDVRLGGHLKHWADCYPFIGEVKGGSIKIRPNKLVVTSQYRIEEIWEDKETREALLRRFVVIEKLLGQNILLF